LEEETMSYYLQGVGGLGFGAVDFDSSAVWHDWLSGGSGDNAAGMRAADAIRAALGQLGYGTVAIGQPWGTASDKAAYSKFAAQQNIPAASGMPTWWPTQTGVTRLGELAKAGGTPGGGPAQQFHTVDGQVIPGGVGPGGAATAAMSGGEKLGLLVLALGALGAVALVAKRKKGGAGRPSQASVGV